MVKRINVSVSDELYEKIQSAKQGFSKEFSLSKIFQKAIERELEDAIRRTAIWNDGFQYGVEYLNTLDDMERGKAKQMVDSFPRKVPEDIFKLLLLADVVTTENLDRHTDLRHYWKSVEQRFDFMSDVGDRDSWDEWVGTPPTHEGVEIPETGISERHEVNITTHEGSSKQTAITTHKSASDIRYEKVIQLWREGVIAGIKDATKSL